MPLLFCNSLLESILPCAFPPNSHQVTSYHRCRLIFPQPDFGSGTKTVFLFSQKKRQFSRPGFRHDFYINLMVQTVEVWFHPEF
jgi:hypothetical protein